MGVNLTKQIVIISSLMHDIGKFAQRAGRSYNAKLENEYCPTYKGKPSHQHVLYTDYFLESADFPLPLELLKHRSTIARLASAHHKPGISTDKKEQLFEYIIQRADCLSSGLDRIEGEEQGNHKKDRLESVFSHIKLKYDNKATYYHELKKIDEYKAIFPCPEKENKPNDYAKLFEDFVKELKKIPLEQGFNAYTSSLISVLEKYTYCIPSSTYKTVPDISLYDHAVTTTAIAQALWASCEENNACIDQLEKQNFLLFSMEFSGIQKYIFSGNASKGFAKILRARSFHLQALTRSIILYTLDKLALNPVAKIMDAGGKFILLLPNTQKVSSVIQEIMQEIEIFFANNFQGELKAPMALIETTQKDMQQKNFIAKLDELNDMLETNKFKPFKHYFTKNSPVFDLSYHKGICSYCDRKQAIKNIEESPVCEECSNLIEIGSALTNSQLGIFTHTPLKGIASLELINGIYLVLDEGKGFSGQEIRSALDCINLKSSGIYTNYPIVGYIPKKAYEKGYSYENMSFEDLAYSAVIAEENRCVSMLGILKADVDNLGFIFSLGFNKKLSVSRFAQLSRMLNTFFSEYLVQVIKENDLKIYTIFAGGDDLFILGSWTDIIKFAQILHKDFTEFTANNEDITISAGIAFSKPRLPVSKITDMAEEALEHSKGYGNGKIKNACSLFGVTCPWQEFSNQYSTGKELEKMILENKISQGFVRRLLNYADQCRCFSEKGEIRHGLYISHLQYDMARNIKINDKETEKIKQQIAEIATNKEKFQNARMAISYALYKTRTAQKQDKE